ncbi:MAG: type II secretion system protein [Planctomycetota bacterium]
MFTTPKRRRSGYTLIELMVATASSGVVMAGMASSLYIATQAMNLDQGAAAKKTELATCVSDVLNDLRHATSFTEKTATAVTFVVPDRDGDAAPETLRYAWSGVSGEPLTLEYNSGAAATVVDSVTTLDFTYLERTIAGGVVEEPATPSGVVFQEFTEAKAASDTTSLTIDTPADVSEGDLLIACVATDGETDSDLAAISSGWTVVNVGTRGDKVTLGVWWKLASSSEASNASFSWSASERAYGWMMRFTGHDQANPINVSDKGGGGNNETPTITGVTTTVDDCLVLRMAAFDHDDITVDDCGMADHITITMDSGSGSNETCSGGAAYAMQETAGDTGDANFTLTAAEQFRFVVLAIAPEASP